VRAPDAAALILPDGTTWSDGVAPPATAERVLPRLDFTAARRLGGLHIGRGEAIELGPDDPP
jgi:hypothetical protein